MNAELKSVLTIDQSQYLCLAPSLPASWLLKLQSDIDGEDSEDSGLPSHFFTIFTIDIDNADLEGVGRHGAGEQLEPGLVWQRLESVSVESCLYCHVCDGYLGGAGRGDLRYSEQAEQVGHLQMDVCSRNIFWFFFYKYCLFSKDLIHNCSQTEINQPRQ